MVNIKPIKRRNGDEPLAYSQYSTFFRGSQDHFSRVETVQCENCGKVMEYHDYKLTALGGVEIGCGDCVELRFPEEGEILVCPICGQVVTDEDEAYFYKNGELAGCEFCVSERWFF